MSNKEQWEKEFEKTMLITKAGVWLECSDYEGTVIEIKTFISNLLQARRERRDNELIIMMDECEKKGWDFARFIRTFIELKAIKKVKGE